MCSFRETKCSATCQVAVRSGSGSSERFRETSDKEVGEGTSPRCGSALGTKTASVNGRRGVGAPNNDDEGVRVEAVPPSKSTSRGTCVVLDSGSWLLERRRCWTASEPSFGRLLSASRLWLRLRTLGRDGGIPSGLKGVDSSPSWAGAQPSRKAPKMTFQVSSSVTPENESYISGSIDPGVH